MGPGLGRGPGPSGGGDPPPGGGGVRVVVLGQPGDLQEVEEPAFDAVLLRRDGGNREVPPGRGGQPQRTMRGSSGQ